MAILGLAVLWVLIVAAGIVLLAQLSLLFALWRARRGEKYAELKRKGWDRILVPARRGHQMDSWQRRR